jgi:enterochelin esterase-like enzyme
MRGDARSTRRRLLGGAAAVAMAGTAAGLRAERSGEAARVWHHFADKCVGPDGAVPDDPAHAPVSGMLHSAHVPDGDVGWMVWRPDGVSASSPLPVILGLPGRGSPSSWVFDDLHLHAFLAAELARTGAAVALASVDGGESYWHARSDGEDRMAMLETEFLPFLERRFGLGGPGRVAAGWSMGGYGALLAAERDPGGWSGVAVASPAIWPDYGDVWVGDAFDGRDDFGRNDVFAGVGRLERMPVWIGCGMSDPFYDNARRFAAALPGARTDWADGGHDQCLWRLVAPPQMAVAVAAVRA